MIKSKELVGPSCLTSATDDEPIFVLKSTDELAPLIVRQWADMYLMQKSEHPGGPTHKQWNKYHEAKALADQMDQWRSTKTVGGNRS